MSARPGRIIADIPIEFPYPRQPELRYEPRFGELCGRVAEALKEAYQ